MYLQVQPDPVVERQIAAAADLPQAGHAGPDAEAAHQRGLGEPVARRGSGSGRGPTSDISPRRTFTSCGISSMRGPPEQPAHRRDPRILPDLEHRAGRLVPLLQRGLQRLGVRHHGSQLVHPERPAVQPVALLGEEHRPRAGQLDGHCRDQEDRRRARGVRPRRRPDRSSAWPTQAPALGSAGRRDQRHSVALDLADAAPCPRTDRPGTSPARRLARSSHMTCWISV